MSLGLEFIQSISIVCYILQQGELDSPANFVTELRNADLKGEKRLRVLESLRVSLTSNPVRYGFKKCKETFF